MIKTKNVIFDYSLFYNLENFNLAHLLNVFVNNVIKIIELSKKFTQIFNKIIDEKNTENIGEIEKNQRFEKFANALKITKIDNSVENQSINKKIIQTIIPKSIPKQTLIENMSKTLFELLFH